MQVSFLRSYMSATQSTDIYRDRNENDAVFQMVFCH
jgi:hypothetical protein